MPSFKVCLTAIVLMMAFAGCTANLGVGGTDIVSVGIENKNAKQQQQQSSQQMMPGYYPPPYYVPYY